MENIVLYLALQEIASLVQKFQIQNVPNVVKNFIEIRARKAVPKVDCFFVIENVKMRLKKLED
tara:strand:- start:556 stop:744 length:189 start_codon:yes stop_codon:yes gene_type:complete